MVVMDRALRLDFQRAVLAYQYAEPLVAMNGLNIGLRQIGGSTGDWRLFQHFLDPHGLALTGNSTTIYVMGFLDLRKEGPMVVEVTPGSYGAFFDLWQQTIAGVDPDGADKGQGGKFLVPSDEFKDAVPDGYYIVRSRTALAAYFARGIVRHGDIAEAAKGLETTRTFIHYQSETIRHKQRSCCPPARTSTQLDLRVSSIGPASPMSSIISAIVMTALSCCRCSSRLGLNPADLLRQIAG